MAYRTGALLALPDLDNLAENWDSADSTGNVLLFPAAPVNPQHGVLAALRGGLVTDASLRPRVSAIVGPGATLRGLATRLRPIFVTAATPQHPAPTVDELARGIAVYSEFYLPLLTMAEYRDGLRIPLPIEIDVNTGDWILNADSIRLWASSFPATSAPALDQRPARLAIPDPAAVATDTTALLQTAPTTLARGIHLQARMVSNPFAAVFVFFEAMRRLAANAFPVALEFLDQSVNHQLDLLATLSAGNAVLRRLNDLLANPPAQLNAQQNASLTRGSQMLQRALVHGGVRVAHTDLPETPQQLTNRAGNIPWQAVLAADPPAGIHRMVLGRDVLAGRVANFVSAGHTFRGPAFGGRISPRAFIAANAALINPTNDPVLAARLQIVEAIAVNEGFLDAVRLRDKGFLSIGMQQWSAHVNLELPALLHRFKTMAPDEFLLFFQLHNLNVRPDGTDGHGNPSFMQQRIERNGALTDLGTQASRRDFYGGTTVGATTTFRTDWAVRSRIAAIASPRFRAAQILEAASRLDRIVREVGSVNVGGAPMPLTTLITSQQGVALILDAHINMPGHVANDLQAAANAAGLHPSANALDQAITNNYETIRHTHDTAARNANINALNLDRNHASFAGW